MTKRKWADDLAIEAKQAAGNRWIKELYKITRIQSEEKGDTVILTPATQVVK